MSSLDKNKIAQNLSKMIQIDTVKTDKLTQYEEFQKLLENLYPNIYDKGEKVIINGSLL